MRAWELARPGVTQCGRCPARVAEGAPVLIITGEGARWRRVRCVDCAARLGERPAPEVLAALQADRQALREAAQMQPRVLPPRPRALPRAKPRRFRNTLDGAPLDVKQRQLGDD